MAKPRIAVAMSGGVDSAATAALMVDEGYEVIGLTMQLYPEAKNAGSCCGGRDTYDAKRVADKLGIAHYTLDYEKAFSQYVIQDFAASYANGETPIPCVRCNQYLKFDKLLRLAKSLDATALATGHYVRKVETRTTPTLWQAKDLAKDQSYFLFATTAEQLAYLRFPLGEFSSKAAVRQYAQKCGLRVAQKAESQDICFVSDSYLKIVANLKPEATTQGEIVSTTGKVLGTHKGLAAYTVGQRKGLGIASPHPLYVTALDTATNRVIVGTRDELATTTIRLKNVNWLTEPKQTLRCHIKYRSNGSLADATITMGKNNTATLRGKFEAVSQGQAAVFYQNQRVLGGGWVT